MKKYFRFISLLLSLLFIVNLSSNVVQAYETANLLEYKTIKQNIMDTYRANKDRSNYKDDEIIIKLKQSSGEASLSSFIMGGNLKIKKKLNSKTSLLSIDKSKENLENLLNALNMDSSIEYAEPNYISNITYVPNETYYNFQWGIKNTSTPGIDINAESAWDITKGKSTVLVGVMDSGIDYNHEDLRNNIWTNTNEIEGNGIDDDKNGFIDDVRGWDFVNNDNNPYDDNDHGTHVAGIIGAEHNGIGVAGVAPNVTMVPLKVASASGSLYASDVVEAINYGDNLGIKIYNCSFGGNYFSQAEYDAIKNSPALFMCAAGNGDEYGNGVNNDLTSFYPASFDSSNIISIASIDKFGNLSTFSNYGVNSVDIAAPGTNIASTVPGSYVYMSGTSMATPFVTGVAALLKSNDENKTTAEIMEYILGSTKKLASLNGKVKTGALVQAREALELENSSNESIGVSSGFTLKSINLYSNSIFKSENYNYITVKAFKDNSTITRVYANYKRPGGMYIQVDLSSTGNDNFYGSIPVFTDIEGAWTLDSIVMEDSLNNIGIFTSGEFDLTGGSFTVKPPDTEPPAVNINISGGTYYELQRIYLSPSEDAEIYYTLDGSDPNKNSLVYNSGGINIDRDVSLKYIAVDRAGNYSPVYQQDYVIKYIEPISASYVNTNQSWGNNIIYGDLYIAPNRNLDIYGSVIVYGNVYVMGTLTNYGTLSITGSLNCKSMYFSYSSPYNGTVLVLGGYISSNSTNVSNEIYDIPFKVYEANNKTIVCRGNTLNLTGAVLPIADLYLDGSKIDYFSNGTFIKTIDITNKSSLTFTIVDGIGNVRVKKFNLVRTDLDNIVPVNSVGLDIHNYSLYENENVKLNASINPYDASIKDLIWTSSDESVAMVDNGGMVTAISPGKAVIKAITMEGEYEDSCSITVVKNVEGVTLDRHDATLNIGQTITLQPAITPLNATNKEVTWESSNSYIASVDGTGKVTANNPGIAVITVSTVDGGFKDSCIITSKIPVSSVTLNYKNLTMYTNQEINLVPTIYPSNATNKNVTWKSTNESVATVDANGKVTCVGKGSTQIYVYTEDENKSAYCNLEVYQGADSVKLNVNSLTLDLNSRYNYLTASVLPADAYDKTIKWESDNTNVVRVDSYGNITPVGVGTAVVKATSTQSGASDTCTITIVKKVTGISFNTSSADMEIGESIRLDPQIKPVDASNKNVTYTSSDESVLTVDSQGLVTAVGVGSASIIATTEDGGHKAYFYGRVVIKVTGVEVENKNMLVNIGSSYFINYKIYPENATDNIVFYESDNQEVVRTIEGSNYLEAAGVGEANVKVYTMDGGYYDTCHVTVIKPVEYLECEQSYETIKVGESLNLIVHVYPEDATIKDLIWSSSDETIATVDNTGKVTALKPGYVSIKAETFDGSRSTGCQFFITQGVNGISLNKTNLLIKPHNQELLTVDFNPENATNKNIIWESSNPSVASVEYGTVSAYNTGTAVITATSEDGGYKATCNVTVDEGIQSVSITGPGISEAVNTETKLKKGSSIVLTAIVRPENTLFNKGVVWYSNNEEVATVDSNGRVTGHKRGVAIISATASDNGVMGICKVTVYEDSNITPFRLGGSNRFETAVEVSKAGWTTSDNVVLVNGHGFADALTGVSLAYIKDAPILLTAPDSLADVSYKEILRLKAKNIYIFGGTGVVGKNIEDFLTGNGFNVIRIAGNNRFETAIAIGSEVVKGNKPDTAILTTAYNYPDALAISSYAAMNKYPVLYTDTNTLTAKTKEFLVSNGIKNIIITGGVGAVSYNVQEELLNSGFNVNRIDGENRYRTALNITERFNDTFGYDIMIATGANFPDALAGGVLAAKKKIPILLVSSSGVDSKVETYIKENGTINMYILGGTGVIPDNIIK